MRFRGIETGEMLANDLVWLVALDAVRARIPSEHVSIGIEQENRVVGNSFQQQLKALFGMFYRSSICIVLAPAGWWLIHRGELT
jgi:hypothetical protein